MSGLTRCSPNGLPLPPGCGFPGSGAGGVSGAFRSAPSWPLACAANTPPPASTRPKPKSRKRFMDGTPLESQKTTCAPGPRL